MGDGTYCPVGSPQHFPAYAMNAHVMNMVIINTGTSYGKEGAPMRSSWIPVMLIVALLMAIFPITIPDDVDAAQSGDYPANYNMQDYEPSAEEQWDLDVTQTSDGRFFAVWADSRLLYSDIRSSKSQNGTVWGDGLPNNDQIVNSDTGGGNDHWHPSITNDDRPRLYTIWLDNGGDDTRLMLSTSNNSGALWAPMVQITAVTGKISEPWIRWSPTVGLVIVYVLERSRNETGPMQRDIMFTRSTDDGETFSTPIVLNDDDTDEDQLHPKLTVSEMGRVAVAWEDYRNGDSISRRNSDIFAIVTDNGISFSSNFRVGAPDDEQQQLPDLAFSQNGDLIVVWQESTLSGWRIKYSIGWSSPGSLDMNLSEDHFGVANNITRKDQFKPKVDYIRGSFAIAWTEIDTMDFYLIRTGYISRAGEIVSGDHIVDNTIDLGKFINDPDIYIAEMVKETVAVIGSDQKTQVFWLDRRTDPNPSNDIKEDSDPYTATARHDLSMPLGPKKLQASVNSVSWGEATISWERSPDIEFKGYYLTIGKGSNPDLPDERLNDGSILKRTETAFTFKNLEPETEYQVRLMTLDRMGQRSDSNPVTFTTGSNGRPSFFFSEPNGVSDASDEGFLISWECSDPEEIATFTLHYDTDLDPDGQVFLYSGTTADDNGFGSFHWNTSSLTPGGYTINATIDDGVNDPLTVHSPAVIVTHRTIVLDHPRVMSVSVDGGKVTAHADAKVRVTFSKPISQVSITEDTVFVLDPMNIRVEGTISMTGTETMTWYPDGRLELGSEYRLILRSDIKDLEGLELDGQNIGQPSGYEFSIITRSAAGIPEVRKWAPQGPGVPLRPMIEVLFDIPMSPSSFSEDAMSLMGPDGEEVLLDSTVDEDGFSFVATTRRPLKENSTYTMNLSTGLISLKGQRIDGGFEWSFTTGAPDMSKDSDNDQVPDDLDIFPNDPMESRDTDNDMIGDNTDLDDDGDGMSDIWEEQYGLDPLNGKDADLDPDGDGKTNLEEFRAGSNPISRVDDNSSLTTFLLVVVIGLLIVLILAGYAIFQRNKFSEERAHRHFFQEE